MNEVINEVGVFTRASTQSLQKEKILRVPTKADILPTTLIFLAGRAGLLGMNPFAAAMFASIYDKKTAYLGMSAALLGLLSGGMGASSVKYIFAMILFWLYTRIREDYKQNEIISSAVCGMSVLAGGIALMTYQPFTLYDFMLLSAEAIISSFMYIVFLRSDTAADGKRRRLSQEEIICFCISAGIIIMGFSGVVLPFGMELTRLLSAYAVMLLAMNTSLAASGAGALATGMVCGMDTESISALMGTYGLCGLVGNMLKPFGKYGVMLGFLSGCAVIMLCEGTSLDIPLNISEIIGAGFLFTVTPDAIHGKISAFFAKNTAVNNTNMGKRVKAYLSDKLSQTAKAFSGLAESFKAISEKRLNMGDVAVIFDDTAERVCKHCSMASHCWQRCFSDTYRDMYTMLDVMERKGKIAISDLPEGFSERCIKGDKLINSFAHVYELYKERVMWEGEMAESRDLLAEQYREISDIMNQFAGEVSGGFEFMEEIEGKISEELDKEGINTGNVSVVQSSSGTASVEVKAYGSYEKDDICRIASQVLDMPMRIDGGSEAGGIRLVSKCGFELEVGTAQATKHGEEENGDSITYFSDEWGQFALAISDGMGSGRNAREESSMTTDLLRRFMKAGFDRNVGISIVNSSLALRSEHECFSTVDLLVIDKDMGKAEFIKAGAPESYLMRNGSIETVYSSSLPAGMLKKADTDFCRYDLADGDVIVMMSDGVSDAGKTLLRGEWIKNIMLTDGLSCEELAQKLLEGAVKRSQGNVRDDMTVAVVKAVKR